MKIKSLKPLWIVLIVLVSLLLLAVIVGVLNGTVGGGEWQIGWQSYRYESENASVGGGTVYATVTALDVDWIRGDVEVIVSDDDRYPSISERRSDGEPLSDAATLRWWVSDGCLVIKCRDSGNYLSSSMPEKKLTVRIPREMMVSLVSLDVNSLRGNVSLILPTEMGFTVTHESTGGQLLSQIPLDSSPLGSTFGNGQSLLRIRTKKGNLLISAA